MLISLFVCCPVRNKDSFENLDDNMTSKEIILSLALVLCTTPIFVGGRQMCYYCGFQANVGKECINDPKSWTNGDPHVRCEYDCVIYAMFSAATGKPTFINRGCQDANRPNGCEKAGDTHTCFFSCNAMNYCNDRDLSHSPLHDFDGASSLTPRSPLGLLFLAFSLVIVMLI